MNELNTVLVLKTGNISTNVTSNRSLFNTADKIFTAKSYCNFLKMYMNKILNNLFFMFLPHLCFATFYI